jgi:hypothetical protein
MSENKSKRELLKDKVVDLVKEFIKAEGGITQRDLKLLFGDFPNQQVATALSEINIMFC